MLDLNNWIINVSARWLNEYYRSDVCLCIWANKYYSWCYDNNWLLD
jgi:hypothetical protein